MLYTDLIDDTPVTMTARQLKLAIQEANLVSRETALREAAELFERTHETPYVIAQLGARAENTAHDREELQRDIRAALGFFS